ncbi:MAG: CBS domain-containing protein [archaeon]
MAVSVFSLRAKDLVSSAFVSVQVNDTLSKVLGALKQKDAKEAIVLDKTTLVGLISDSGLLRNVNITKTKASTVMRTLPSVSPTDSFDRIVTLMRDADVRILPVLEKNKVVGVITAQSVLSALQSSDVFASVTAKDLATFHPRTIAETDTVSKAMSQMKEWNVRKLPVIDSKKKTVGVLRTESVAIDIVLGMDRHERDGFRRGKNTNSMKKESAANILVRSMMDEDVPTVSSSEKGKKVLQYLSRDSNPTVLVTNNGSFGLVSVQNVLDVFLNASKSSSSGLTSPISITHLPDIDEIDRAFVEETLQRTYAKVERILKSDHTMHVVYKQLNKDHLRRKTEVKISIQGAGKTLNASASDWKVRFATKEACAALEHELEKRFKSGNSNERRKSRR